MKKGMSILILCMNLISCSTTSQPSLEKISVNPESFFDNPRIVHRDVTRSPVSVKKNVFKKNIDSSFKEEYGESINDSFNNTAGSSSTFSLMSAQEPIVAHNEVNIINPSTRTTYVPLTFPIPPPRAMIEKFHMQVE